MTDEVDVGKEISEGIKNGKIIVGKERTLKLMRQGKIKRVYLAKNTPEVLRKEIEIVGKAENVEIRDLNKTSNQVGVMVGKRFNVLVLGVLR